MTDVIFKELSCKNNKRIAIAELNAPKSLNALNLSMIRLLTKKLTSWQQDDNIAVVILQGAGEKAFCAGGDVVSLYRYLHELNTPIDDDVITSGFANEFFSEEYVLDQLIHNFSKPIMIWGDGYIMGGGIGLFAGASHRITTERTLMAMPEVSIGLYPDVGSSWFLNKTPEDLGLFLGITGAVFNAADANYLGLSDYTIDSSSKNGVFDHLLIVNWQDNDQNHCLLDQALKDFSKRFEHTLPAEVKNNKAAIAKLLAFDNIVDIHTAILNVQTDNKWLNKAKNKLLSGSPLSACIIYRQLQTTKALSLSECFTSELNLILRCCQYTEACEGIRALLVDKDKSPNWSFSNISDVDHKLVDWFFSPIDKKI
ncbi:enoyl-CoA hydratase/isomerase family protein [Colwellia hornerae]|uniref:3-hydroxyisobutyryl-CoA hydrolase n=1 Tax=Colwellia hornerae TaxID=89402 RepID=A0A5C6QP69_9GAMM|nr:enoyl-CoA hydratase/isomerase family protein [Colwellia hornerae]TWX54669.1 enoyl-CoA hydratase/isomerase family protein [Colwellia hornerae]TWX61109.1 enoyl-CoA hydratase/isomerase family protein [Colwellia hornerae]TWX70362.1 enoyl-CoA hydratase/isomerase family protein [Colwellia hornerae]